MKKMMNMIQRPMNESGKKPACNIFVNYYNDDIEGLCDEDGDSDDGCNLRAAIAFIGNRRSVGIFIVPRKTTFTIDSMGFKNNVKRVLFGDINSTIIVRDSSFVNNTYGGEGSCIRVEKGSVIIDHSLFYNNTCQQVPPSTPFTVTSPS